MSKFNLRTVQDDTGWSAEIFRKITAKELKVTLKKDGFSSENEAKKWAETELKRFVTEYNIKKRQLKNTGQ